MAQERAYFDAVTRGDAGALADLLRAEPALVRAAEGYSKTGLHIAAELGYAEVAQLGQFTT